LSRENLKKNSH